MKRFIAMLLTAMLIFPAAALAEVSEPNAPFGGLTEILGNENGEVYGVGETVDIGELSVTFESVMEATGSADSRFPQEGNVFLICEFTIENKSEEMFFSSVLLCFNMKCDGEFYPVSHDAIDVASLAVKMALDSAAEPGKKINGVVGYEVPADWENFKLRFTPYPYQDTGAFAVFSPYVEPEEAPTAPAE